MRGEIYENLPTDLDFTQSDPGSTKLPPEEPEPDEPEKK